MLGDANGAGSLVEQYRELASMSELLLPEAPGEGDPLWYMPGV